MTDRKTLKAQGKARAKGESWKILTLHTAVSAGIMLLVFLIQLLLEGAISQTGGLGGLQQRTMLSAISVALTWAVTLVMPFWEAGALHTSLLGIREETPRFRDLAQGFVRFGPFLRYWLIRAVLLFLVAMACANAASMVSLFLPMPGALEEILTDMDMGALTNPELLVEKIPPQELLLAMLPMGVVMLLLYGAATVIINLRLWCSEYFLFEEGRMGALAAMLCSLQATKGNWGKLLLLELSYWWYYLLGAVLSVVANLPLAFQALGVTGFWSGTGGEILFYVLYCVGTVALTAFAGVRRQLTCAAAYRSLLPQQS